MPRCLFWLVEVEYGNFELIFKLKGIFGIYLKKEQLFLFFTLDTWQGFLLHINAIHPTPFNFGIGQNHSGLYRSPNYEPKKSGTINGRQSILEEMTGRRP